MRRIHGSRSKVVYTDFVAKTKNSQNILKSYSKRRLTATHFHWFLVIAASSAENAERGTMEIDQKSNTCNQSVILLGVGVTRNRITRSWCE